MSARRDARRRQIRRTLPKRGRRPVPSVQPCGENCGAAGRSHQRGGRKRPSRKCPVHARAGGPRNMPGSARGTANCPRSRQAQYNRGPERYEHRAARAELAAALRILLEEPARSVMSRV